MTWLRALWNRFRTWWLRRIARRARVQAEATRQEIIAALPKPETFPPRDVALHWSSDGTPVPYCGAPPLKGTRWTVQYEYATCPACRAAGFGLLLRRKFTSR